MDGYGFDEVTIHPTQTFSVLNWTLKKNQLEGPSFTTMCLINHPQSKIEATKCVSSLKEVTGSPTSHSKKKKKTYSAKDPKSSQPLASTHMVVGIHKESLQATGGPTSLGFTNEVRADPQLTSVVSASTTEP
ncbi:hypothetical protein Tco_0392089, partial [Tanacetum coccineum]